MYEEVLKKVLNSLKSDGLILEQLLPEYDNIQISSEYVIELLEASYPLVYDDDNDTLQYIDANGVTQNAPDLSIGITESALWLCDLLPTPAIDFEQGGSLRKSEEAKALYTITCIGVVMQKFKEDIIEKFKAYNFKIMSFENNEFEFDTMVGYLNTYLNLNSIRINAIVSSAAIQISRNIEKKDVFWKYSLSLEEISEFSRLSREIKNIYILFERERKLNPSEMSKLTRVEKLQTIDERDLLIQSVIEASPCAMLYKISKLNSERLSPYTKAKILKGAIQIAKAKILEENVTGYESDEMQDREKKKQISSLTRMAVTTLRTKEIAKYRAEGDEYKFRKKV